MDTSPSCLDIGFEDSFLMGWEEGWSIAQPSSDTNQKIFATLITSEDNHVSWEEPIESPQYHPLYQPSAQNTDIDFNLLPPIDQSVHRSSKGKKDKKRDSSVTLSQSVGVGIPQSSSWVIELSCELEESYRARYKSDYFPLHGPPRRPRYVADRSGRHYITLKVPPCLTGQIRVDWVTVLDENRQRYWMPYKFQVNHESLAVPDQNPSYVQFESDQSGSIKLYLVLIKSKQEALKSCQPLQRFIPGQDPSELSTYSSTEEIIPLPAKRFIEKYRLEKSQLAFTLCTPGDDGNSFIVVPNTIVYSTVIEEEDKKKEVRSNLAECPNCSHTFHYKTNGSQSERLNETSNYHRKAKKAKTTKNSKT